MKVDHVRSLTRFTETLHKLGIVPSVIRLLAKPIEGKQTRVVFAEKWKVVFPVEEITERPVESRTKNYTQAELEDMRAKQRAFDKQYGNAQFDASGRPIHE